MNIDQVQIYRYRVLLNENAKIFRMDSKYREGAIIRIRDDKGVEGLGEVSPLLGFSQEPLADTFQELQAITDQVFQMPLPDHLDHLQGDFARWLESFEISPSIQFGLEMAVVDILAQHKGQNFAQLKTSDGVDFLAIDGLLAGGVDAVCAQAKQMFADGTRHFKLKVGQDDLATDIEKVARLNDLFSGEALLHVDANRAWSMDEAISFGQKVGCAALEYIEEPSYEFKRLDEFFSTTMIPMALDESLREHDFTDIKGIEGLDFVILKPTLMGGLERAWVWIEECLNLAIRPVISSSFETDLGLTCLARLASAIPRVQSAGLGTWHSFASGLLNQPLAFHDGGVDISHQHIGFEDLNQDCLEEL